MARAKLTVSKRAVLGRKVKKLRSEGILPANIYGKGVKSTSISVPLKDFEKVFESAGETALIDLALGRDTRAVLVRNVQKDPIDESILHVDFQEVNLKEKVTANIPVELLGESPAEKQSLGTAVQYIDEVEVEALPADLPEKFEIDISNLSEVDQSILVKDLSVDKAKVEIKTDLTGIIVKVEPPTKEEVPVVAAPVEGEAPIEAGAEGEEKKPVEGEVSPQPEEKPKK